MSGVGMKVIEKLVSIFVEGVTDKIMYKTLFTKVFGFDELKGSELEAIQNDLRLSDSLVPFKDSIVIFSEGRSSLVVIKNKNGRDELFKFAEDSVHGIKPLKRSVKSPPKVDGFDFNIKMFRIIFIFDEDVAPNKISKLRNLYTAHKEVLIDTQPTPEKIGLEFFNIYLSQQEPEWRELFDECGAKLERLLKNHDFSKVRFNLMKAMIGERCYYQLFETLFSEITEDEIRNRIRWLNAIPGL